MSELILHCSEFLNAISKCSVGSTFDFFQMIVSKDSVKSGTTNANQSLVSILKFQNNFLDGIKESEVLEFNFISPAASIIPQAKLFSNNELKCSLGFSKGVAVSKVKVTEKETKTSATWNMGVPNASLIFSNNSKLKAFEPFVELEINKDFIEVAEAIRKAGSSSNKVYFTTLKNALRIEATDYKNDFSSNFNKTLTTLDLEPAYQHLIMCYDAPMFFSVLKQLDLAKEFTCKIIYKTDRKIAALMISCPDESEIYFMPSVIEDIDTQRALNRLKEDD